MDHRLSYWPVGESGDDTLSPARGNEGRDELVH